MSFAKIGAGLATLISISDQQAVFWKAFLQAFIDHNGGPAHLDALIKDAAEGRRWFNELAKKVIGGVWNFADNLVDLGSIDLTCPFKDFIARFPSVKVGNAGEDYQSRWIGEGPSGPCKYKLVHFGRPMSFNGILEAARLYELGHKVEYAGFRELIVYVAALKPEDLKCFTIVAPGSLHASNAMRARDDWAVSKTFPTAGESGDKIDIGWHGVHDGDEDRKEYEVRNFFLVRVYE